MCICLGLSQGLVSDPIPHVLGLGLDPGSYQDLKIPPITAVKLKSQCRGGGGGKSQMPGIPRTEFVLSSVQNTDQTISRHPTGRGGPSEHLGECTDGTHMYPQHRHTPISTLASAHHVNSDVELRTQVGSFETPPGFETHVAQIALVHFPLIIFPFSAFTRSPKGPLMAADLVPTATRIRKASFSGEKAELQSPGQEVRATGFSDRLTQRVGSRWSFFNQALKKAPRGL